jgi:hypothetical protein
MEEEANIMPQFDETLYCALCYIVYSDTRRPASLRTCDHIYCESCIQQWDRLTCPLCRHPYTKEDIKIERRYLDMVKTYLNSLRLTNEEALRIQVRQRFRDLEPSLESLITLERSIIGYYRAAIKNTNHSLWGSGSSMILKSFAAGLCCFPATAPLGILAMGVTTVTDIGQNIAFIQKKNGTYCAISEVIKRHDQILHDQKVKQCFDLYNELQKIKYIKHFKKGEAELAHHLETDFGKTYSSGLHGGATVINGMSYFNIDKIDFSGLVAGKNSGEWAKMPRSVSPMGKSLIIAFVLVEWGLFLYEMKSGKVQKEDLEKKIEETERTIEIYETFLKKSKKNEI